MVKFLRAASPLLLAALVQVWPWLSLAVEPPAFTHLGDAEDLQARNSYEVNLLRLALDKTVANYGPYRLLPSPPDLTQTRAVEQMREGRYENFLRTFGYDADLGRDPALIYVKFPVYLGILGYRTCFTSAEIEQEVAAVRSLDDLHDYIYGFGVGWSDAKVFTHNGFKTLLAPRYQSLFKMTALNRVNLFCRGSNEILYEYERYRDLTGLRYNRSFAIYYPLPHFFFTHKDNAKAAQRVAEGLHKAWQDGSLLALWHAQFGASVAFADIPSRHVFVLDSPLDDDLDFDMSPYLVPLLENKPAPSPPVDR